MYVLKESLCDLWALRPAWRLPFNAMTCAFPCEVSASSPVGHAPPPPATQGESGVVVGLRITKPTASVPLLGDDRARTLSCVEAAAAGCAVGVASAWTGDKLCSSTVSSTAAAGRYLGGGGGGGSARVGRGLPEQGAGGIVVWLRITKPAASVYLLGNNGTRTFARVEATAGGGAAGVAGAWTSNELCALADDQKSH